MRIMESDLFPDPFQERSSAFTRPPLQLLGARIQFESNSRELLRLVDAAYAGLPRHRLSSAAPCLRIKLLLMPSTRRRGRSAPPPLSMLSGAELLAGATESSNFVVLAPRERAALVVVTPQMLRSSYHVRYELIEFAVFTLAARVQQLVPLHAACVGHHGRGVLLMGPSGAGKTTVALQSVVSGLDFLSEDSVFVEPDTLLATGTANFLHVRTDSLRWLGRSRAAAMIRKSPVITRRSGARKYELDLRRECFRLARAPLKIVSAVFLSARSAAGGPLLRRMGSAQLLDTLGITQAYAAGQPQWRNFSRNLAQLDAFELRRGHHPLEAVDALQTLLAGRRRAVSHGD
jgi:hypothetical protein